MISTKSQLLSNVYQRINKRDYSCFYFSQGQMASVLNIKRTAALTGKRIDNYAQSFPPLDYSFHNAQKLEGRMIDF